MFIVDTHAHIYSEDETAYPKRENPLRPPSETGTIEHLRREVQANGVSRVTLIQTLTAYRYDNRCTVDTADANRGWTTGVVTLDPLDSDSPRLLEEHVTRSNVRGLRIYPTDPPNATFDTAGHRRLFETAARLGIVVNVLVDPPFADDLAKHLTRHPNLFVVLDHCMNLRAGDAERLNAVRAMARFPNLIAKLTFAVTGSGEPYPCRDTHEGLRAVIEAYGPDRCVWGSDFPTELWQPKVPYGQHLRIFTEELGLPSASLEAILGGTARRLWFA